MNEVWILAIIVGVAWFWLGAMQAKEVAVSAARRACEGQGVLLLDQTVAMQHLLLKRDSYGRVRLRRVYDFEFTMQGDERSHGLLEVQAGRVISLRLELPDQTTLHEVH